MIETAGFRDGLIDRAAFRLRPIRELHHAFKMMDIYFILLVIGVVPKNKLSVDDAEKYARRQTGLLR
nr:hypothetical protein RSP673_13065 [Ralstonia solanacearum P673]